MHPKILEHALSELLKSKIPESKNDFYDFLSLTEAREIVSQEKTKGSIKVAVVKKLNTYFQNTQGASILLPHC